MADKDIEVMRLREEQQESAPRAGEQAYYCRYACPENVSCRATKRVRPLSLALVITPGVLQYTPRAFFFFFRTDSYVCYSASKPPPFLQCLLSRLPCATAPPTVVHLRPDLPSCLLRHDNAVDTPSCGR